MSPERVRTFYAVSRRPQAAANPQAVCPAPSASGYGAGHGRAVHSRPTAPKPNTSRRCWATSTRKALAKLRLGRPLGRACEVRMHLTSKGCGAYVVSLGIARLGDFVGSIEAGSQLVSHLRACTTATSNFSLLKFLRSAKCCARGSSPTSDLACISQNSRAEAGSSAAAIDSGGSPILSRMTESWVVCSQTYCADLAALIPTDTEPWRIDRVCLRIGFGDPLPRPVGGPPQAVPYVPWLQSNRLPRCLPMRRLRSRPVISNFPPLVHHRCAKARPVAESGIASTVRPQNVASGGQASGPRTPEKASGGQGCPPWTWRTRTARRSAKPACGQGLRPYDPDPASGGQGYPPWTRATPGCPAASWPPSRTKGSQTAPAWSRSFVR